MAVIKGRTFQIGGTDDKPFNGYLVTPEVTPAPAVVVLQEILGITAFIDDVCHMLAEAGFVALAPDLFWREEPGLVLDGTDDRQVARGRAAMQAIGLETMAADSLATIRIARGLVECSGKVGAVGYCLGGNLAYSMAMEKDCDAAVSYYGTRMHERLDLADKVTQPLLLHIATADGLCPPEAQARIKAALGPRSNVTIFDYEGAGHAFAREGGMHYDPEATKLADKRTIDFFEKHLRGRPGQGASPA